MNEHVIAEFAITPIGTPTPEVGDYVKACIDIVKKAPGVKYELNSMGTTLEGPLDRILELFKQMNEAPFNMGAKRVYSMIKIDDRRDKVASMASKMKTVGE